MLKYNFLPPPEKAGCFLSTLLIWTSSMVFDIKLLYLGNCMLGLFLSNTAPTSYSLAEVEIGVSRNSN